LLRWQHAMRGFVSRSGRIGTDKRTGVDVGFALVSNAKAELRATFA
jgi:hypothetical protein